MDFRGSYVKNMFLFFVCFVFLSGGIRADDEKAFVEALANGYRTHGKLTDIVKQFGEIGLNVRLKSCEETEDDAVKCVVVKGEIKKFNQSVKKFMAPKYSIMVTYYTLDKSWLAKPLERYSQITGKLQGITAKAAYIRGPERENYSEIIIFSPEFYDAKAKYLAQKKADEAKNKSIAQRLNGKTCMVYITKEVADNHGVEITGTVMFPENTQKDKLQIEFDLFKGDKVIAQATDKVDNFDGNKWSFTAVSNLQAETYDFGVLKINSRRTSIDDILYLTYDDAVKEKLVSAE